MRSEGGYSLVELLVAMTTGMIVLGGIMGVIQITTQHQRVVADRVVANQRARPAMTNIMNDLHSACVAPKVTPVQTGSTGSELRLVSRTGSSVSITPEKHIVTLTGTTLRESIYPVTGGTAPTWTFASTPSSTRTLLNGVTAGSGGVPPMFQYFGYSSGVISTTPFTTPLSAANAAATVQVTVNFSVSPNESGASTADPNASVLLSDAAVFRLSAASEDVTEVNVPCA